MDKHTEDFFKSILSEEPADYAHAPKFADSTFGKIRFYFSQFRNIDYKEKAINFVSWFKNLGGSLGSTLNKKIEKAPKVELLPKAEEQKPETVKLAEKTEVSKP